MFFEPLFGGLSTTYAVYLRLIAKHIVDFLLVIIELFSLGVMVEVLSEYRLEVAIFIGVGHFGPKF